MSRRLTAVARASRAAPPDLRDAVGETIEAMPWVEDTDAAMVALAKRLAAEIEQVVGRASELQELWAQIGVDRSAFQRLQKLEAMCDATKVVGWLGPQLQGVLKELGGSPQARKAMQKASPVGGALASIRANLPTAGGTPGSDNSEDLD